MGNSGTSIASDISGKIFPSNTGNGYKISAIWVFSVSGELLGLSVSRGHYTAGNFAYELSGLVLFGTLVLVFNIRELRIRGNYQDFSTVIDTKSAFRGEIIEINNEL